VSQCNYDRCPLPGAIHVFSDHGQLWEVLCRHHAVVAANGSAQQFTYIDAATGKPFIRITVEVLLEEPEKAT